MDSSDGNVVRDSRLFFAQVVKPLLDESPAWRVFAPEDAQRPSDNVYGLIELVQSGSLAPDELTSALLMLSNAVSDLVTEKFDSGLELGAIMERWRLDLLLYVDGLYARSEHPGYVEIEKWIEERRAAGSELADTA